MKIHLIFHTGDCGEKPYMCVLCQKLFIHGGSLKSHMRTHTGEKPLKFHLRHKLFNKTGDLKRHMRTHTGEKPHKCQLCQKSFRAVIGLKGHMLIHAIEAPYICEICNKGFTLNRTLNRHRRTHSAVRQHSHYEADGGSSVKLWKLDAMAQKQCIEMQGQSTANLSVPFTALAGTGVIDKPNEYLLTNMHPDCSKGIRCLEECIRIPITNSREDSKAFVRKSFGCGVCGEMLEIEKAFQDHCSSHRFSPPGDLLTNMCRFVTSSTYS